MNKAHSNLILNGVFKWDKKNRNIDLYINDNVLKTKIDCLKSGKMFCSDVVFQLRREDKLVRINFI